MSQFLPSLQTMFKGGVSMVAGGAAIGAGLLWYGQNYLVYPSGFPPGSRSTIATPLEYNMPYQDLTLETPDGLHIHAYLMLQRREVPTINGAYREPHQFVRNKHRAAKTPGTEDAEPIEITVDSGMEDADRDVAKSRPTIMIFHANAGNMGHRIPLARLFYEKMRCNVFMLSYRGYGKSEGSPSEDGLRMDAQTALEYVTAHPLLKTTKKILYGQSIGGAVSIDLASRNPSIINGLIIENTFLSIPQLIPSILPYLKAVSFLCHQIWPSADSIKKIPLETPVLMLSGLQDEVVPPEHMAGLWQTVSENDKAQYPEGKVPPVDLEDWVTEKIEVDVEDSITQVEGQTGEKHLEIVERRYRRMSRGTRRWMEFPEGKHNDTCMHRQYWIEVADFVRQFSEKME